MSISVLVLRKTPTMRFLLFIVSGFMICAATWGVLSAFSHQFRAGAMRRYERFENEMARLERASAAVDAELAALEIYVDEKSVAASDGESDRRMSPTRPRSMTRYC